MPLESSNGKQLVVACNCHLVKILCLCLVAYLSSYHEKAINVLYELA